MRDDVSWHLGGSEGLLEPQFQGLKFMRTSFTKYMQNMRTFMQISCEAASELSFPRIRSTVAPHHQFQLRA